MRGIFFRQWGQSGPDVVLVHGHVVSSRYMVPLGKALGRYCRVYAPDLPGSGRSRCPGGALSIPGLADALRDFLGAQGLHRPILLGNSMGCQVVLDLASRENLASRIVLQGPTMDARARKLHVMLGRFFHSAIHEKRLFPLAAIYLSDLWMMGPWRGWRTLQHALADRPEEKAGRVEAPTLVVRGEHDYIAPESWIQCLADALPHGRSLTISGAGHGVHFSETDRFVEAILPFLLSQE